MAAITQFPRGLVALTGLRDMGEAPRELAEAIAPTIDVTQFLLLNRETIAGNFFPGAVGIIASPTVPAGELWYIHQHSAYGINGAGAAIRISLGIDFQGEWAVTSRPGSAAANEWATTTLERPMWLGPGTSLGVAIEAITGAATNLRTSVTFTRLRI